MQQPPKTTLTRYGGWLPANRAIYTSFISQHTQHARSKLERGITTHLPPVEGFEAAMKTDPEMIQLWEQIFIQASPENKIESFDELLHMLDEVISMPPKFYIAKSEEGAVIGEPVGVPIYLLLDLLSNTGAAYDLFRKESFNAALKDLLDAWGDYLQTPDSAKTLNDSEEGWFHSTSIEMLEHLRGEFNATYECPDPDAVNRGFTSWDAFFTREVQSQARPVDAPEDKTLIHSACESTVYRIQEKVKEHDQFWLKGDASYSLYDMLNHHELANRFAGGTVFQAFLSPQDYHRWRAPVDGTIVHIELVPGTYYAVIPDAGAPVDDPDLQPGDPRGALIRSQGWLNHSAARAIFLIEATNEEIGLIAFIGVGMCEVSTCEISKSIYVGTKVSAGDELGMFRFGGSTHALVFGPQVKVTFADHVQVDKHLLVNSIIAKASKA